jgi:hypothetical protein
MIAPVTEEPIRTPARAVFEIVSKMLRFRAFMKLPFFQPTESGGGIADLTQMCLRLAQSSE